MLISRGILRLAVTFVLALTGLAAVQSGEPLTNGDIVKMVRAQLSTNVIMTTIEATPVKFDLSSAGLISLKEAGVEDRIIEAMQAKARARDAGTTTGGAVLIAPEKSELLATSKEPDFILRNFRTMVVDASRASFFGSDQMKAALTQDKGFAALKISIVDDPAVADVDLMSATRSHGTIRSRLSTRTRASSWYPARVQDHSRVPGAPPAWRARS